tara:strand:+ start:3192 stop:3758 length:567 start_codon:yes stop_codon:yes gene_type:complete
MAKRTGEIKMGKTCSTCKFAVFITHSRYSNYGFQGKKQTGFCTVNATPKEVPTRPKRAPWGGGFEADLYKKLKADEIPDKEPYLREFVERFYRDRKAGAEKNYYQYTEDMTAEEKEAEVTKETEKFAVELSKYYDAMLENYIWWRENWDEVRLCHRATTCDRWSQGKTNRESYAKGIVSGKVKKDKRK